MINNRGGVESRDVVHKPVESARTHSFARRCQAADIGEHQTDWDLYFDQLTGDTAETPV